MSNNYLSLVELAKKLNQQASKLEKGKLELSEINDMLENSRDVYERLTILRYKAIVEERAEEKEIILEEEKEEIIESEENGFSFNFEAEELPKISPNQRNLLDEIQEVGGELDTSASVNEQYASTPDKTESVADKLKNSKILDLKKSIGLNQKFLFTNDLFKGNKNDFESVIEKINTFDSIIEAKAYLSSEIENKYNWEEDSSAVKQFISLIERKFN